jgi:hypothetical protein
VVGLLTLAYHAEWDPDAGADLKALQADVASLVSGMDICSISDETPLDKYDVVTELLGSGLMTLGPNLPALVASFVSIFVMLCREIKKHDPDFDIEEFLRQRGLEAADET